MYLYGRYALLRPAFPRDYASLVRWSLRWDIHHPLTRRFDPILFRDFLGEVDARLRDLGLMIVQNSEGKVFGYACIHRLKPWSRNLSVDVVFAETPPPPVRREAWVMLLDFAYRWFPVERVRLQCSGAEPDKIAYVEQLGFRRETVQTSELWAGERLWDLHELTLERASWANNRRKVTESLILQRQYDQMSSSAIASAQAFDDVLPRSEEPTELRIRPLEVTDQFAVFRWYGDSTQPHLWNERRQLLTFVGFNGLLETIARTSRIRVIEDAAREPVGYAQLYHQRVWDETGKLALYLDPPHREPPIVRAALRLSTAWAFTFPAVRKVYVETYQFQEVLASALADLGFAQEGEVRAAYWFDGEYWTRTRWAAYRGNPLEAEIDLAEAVGGGR